MQIPRSRLEKLQVRDESPIHLTDEGFKRLKEKLARLESSLPNLIAETQRTAAYGDRSDSAEYKEAKGRLRATHRQILSTKDLIKRAFIIKSSPSVSGKVQLGSTVVLEMDSAHSAGSRRASSLQAGSHPSANGRGSLEAAGRASSPQAQKTFQIVGPHETDPTHGRISYQSPLGTALMNHTKGDTVTVHSPTGEVHKYRILEIE